MSLKWLQRKIIISVVVGLALVGGVLLSLPYLASAQLSSGAICFPSGQPFGFYRPDLVSLGSFPGNPYLADDRLSSSGCSWRLLPVSENVYLTPEYSFPAAQGVRYEFYYRSSVEQDVTVGLISTLGDGSQGNVWLIIPLMDTSGAWQRLTFNWDGGSHLPQVAAGLSFRVTDSQSEVWIDDISINGFDLATPTMTPSPTITPTITPTPDPGECVDATGQTYTLDSFNAGYDRSPPGIDGIDDLELGLPDSQYAVLPGNINRWAYWSWDLPSTISGTLRVGVFRIDGGGQGSAFGFHPDFDQTPDCDDPSPGNYVCSGSGFEGVPAPLGSLGWTTWSGNGQTADGQASSVFYGFRSGVADFSTHQIEAISVTVVTGCVVTFEATPTPTATITPTATTTPTATASATPSATPLPFNTATLAPTVGPTPSATSVGPVPTLPGVGTPVIGTIPGEDFVIPITETLESHYTPIYPDLCPVALPYPGQLSPYELFDLSWPGWPGFGLGFAVYFQWLAFAALYIGGFLANVVLLLANLGRFFANALIVFILISFRFVQLNWCLLGFVGSWVSSVFQFFIDVFTLSGEFINGEVEPPAEIEGVVIVDLFEGLGIFLAAPVISWLVSALFMVITYKLVRHIIRDITGSDTE